MNQEIKKILKKHYISYDEKKWKNFNNDDNLKEEFYKLWKDEQGKPEHGGYYTKTENFTFNPPKYLPSVKEPFIHIPECGTNDIKFQQKYIDTLNKILLENDKKHIKLDFRNNGGGKPHVMLAGLLPLFNMSKRKILSFITTKTKVIKDIYKKNNCIMYQNNKSIRCGTKLKMNKVKKISIYMNEYTVSAGEESIIALLSLKDTVEIKIKGKRSAGYTTTNQYFELSNGDGIEIPIGYMTDVDGNVYKKGL